MKKTIWITACAAVCLTAGAAEKSDPKTGSAIKQVREWLQQDPASRGALDAQPFSQKKLSAADAAAIAELLWADRGEQVDRAYKQEWEAGELKNGEYRMKFVTKTFGEMPEDGRSLYISLHGGGGTHPAVNDQQWQNQQVLYTPKEGVYFVPRSPMNEWNMWHREYMDGFLDKVIECAVRYHNVNPNKVYILGYSAGGDGLYQLAPRMADRWAAASMMAGHPGNASALPLRNLPFMIFMGGKDAAYNRNTLAAEWGDKLDALQQQDPEGYKHSVTIYPDTGHWMERRDTVALPWMAQYERNPYPDKVVWVQDDVLSERFYWLGTRKAMTQEGNTAVVTRKGNTIDIERNDNQILILHLNDQVVDLNKKVTVTYQGHPIFEGKLKRRIAPIYRSVCDGRGDRETFCADLEVVKNRQVNIL